jgi:heme-degrading monooxygenase HmoA
LEIVLVDRFIVPEEAKDRFLEQVHKSATFLKTLPGFMEGFVYEKADGEGRHKGMTAAVWKDEEAFQTAKRSAAEGFKKIGFNPREIMKNLKLEIERAVYRRWPTEYRA